MGSTRLPGTPRLLRALNDRAALELLLARGPLTRAQLGELTGLSKVTASQLVERLEERGLVTRVGEQAGGRGPNAQLYAVTPGSAHVVGVDVGRRPGRRRVRRHHRRGHRPGRAVHQGHRRPGRRGAQRRGPGGAQRARASWPAYAGWCSAHPAWSTPAPATSRSRSTCPAGTAACSPPSARTCTRRSSSRTTSTWPRVAEAHSGAATGVRGLRAGLGRRRRRPRDRPRRPAAPRQHRRRRRDRLPAGARRADPARRHPARQAAVPASSPAPRRCGRWPASTASAASNAADAIRDAIAAGTAGGPVLDEIARRLALGVASTCVVLDPPLVVLAGEVGLAGGSALAERVQHEVAAITLGLAEGRGQPGRRRTGPAGRAAYRPRLGP